jgi:hypothetical protein
MIMFAYLCSYFNIVKSRRKNTLKKRITIKYVRLITTQSA